MLRFFQGSPPQQARLIGIAGLKNALIILSLNGSFMYLGFSRGAALGSVTLALRGVSALGSVGAICVVAALLLFLVTDPRAQPRALNDEPTMKPDDIEPAPAIRQATVYSFKPQGD